MTLLKILEFPDPRLRTKARPVTEFNAKLRRLADNMLETMYTAKGIGLAATQVNVHLRLLVIDISEQGNEPRMFINPKITVINDELALSKEGCLSVPGFVDKIKRYQSIEVAYQNLEGEPLSLQDDGLLAVCIQHEVDHLNGKLFVDYLSSLKRQQIRRQLLHQTT